MRRVFGSFFCWARACARAAALAGGTVVAAPAGVEGAAWRRRRRAAGAGVVRFSPELRERFVRGALALLVGRWGEGATGVRGSGVGDDADSGLCVALPRSELDRDGGFAGARGAASRAMDLAPDGRPTPSMLLQAAAVAVERGRRHGRGRALPPIPRSVRDHAEAARARSALARSLSAAGRVPEATRVLNELWLLVPASPLAEDAARQLRVLGEGGFGGLVPTQKERVERAERLLSARGGRHGADRGGRAPRR